MQKEYKTLLEGNTAEIIEKKSRFIAYVQSVETENDAYAFIESIKKKHYDARHNCYAFSIGVDMPTLRFSDDGEPQGTAGKPILEVIKGAEVCNICIVVTRYFGGTLLGTGGLVRAYTEAAQKGLDASKVVLMQLVEQVEMQCDYTDFGKIQYILGNESIPIADTVYTDAVQIRVYIPVDVLDYVEKKITEATAARVKLHRKGEIYWNEEL